MHGWDIALALELLALLFGFILWFKAARAEGGPKKLAKVVSIVVIILAVLLAACTVTRAFMYAGAGKAGPYGPGHKCCMMMQHGGFEEGKCPCCGAAYGKGHGPGMGKGRGLGPGMGGKFPCPWMEEPAPEEPKTE
ncbi:MAG TPA: hypothetical protein VMX79_02085 [bacterium]|nr:hypothetical protein [bacterium]